jgi:hypothetical protein
MILIIHHQYLAWQERQPNHLIFSAFTSTIIGRLDAAVYLAANGSTTEPGRPGLGQHVILVLVVGELDLMKHSERLSIAAKPNDVLA